MWWISVNYYGSKKVSQPPIHSSFIKDYYPEKFEYLKGPYEFRSDRPAIELLVGDNYLLDYLSGKISLKLVRQYLNDKEAEWKKERKPYLQY